MSAVPLHMSTRHRGRLVLGTRTFGVYAVAVLTVVERNVAALPAVAMLAGLAVIATLGTRRALAGGTLIALSEALVAAVIIGTQLSDLPYVTLYLIVPPFIASLYAGLGGAATAWLTEITVVVLLSSPVLSLDSLWDRFHAIAPWALTSVGSGLLGAWLHHIDHAPSGDRGAYHSARHLLSELRTVARRLSAGLDPVGIAQQILGEVCGAIEGDAAMVLVLADGGILVPLAQDEGGRLGEVGGDDPVVMECWTTGTPAQESVDGPGGRRARVALPLHIGVRMIGVVVAECGPDVPSAALHELRSRLSEHSVRLDTALVFDEVRTLATADERRRLAREIHDGIAQEVASIGYAVDAMVAASESDQQLDNLNRVRREITRLVSELRLSIFDLRSGVSQRVGLGAALTDYVRQVGTRCGMTVHLSLHETPQRLRVEVETEILRIAQEAITNARRHSGASNMWVTMAADPPHVTLTIADDGHGLVAARSDSYGLRIMRERAERIGAALEIGNRDGGGTQVSITVQSGTSGASVSHLDVITAPRKDRADAYVGLAHR